jgi:hypothetical protein
VKLQDLCKQKIKQIKRRIVNYLGKLGGYPVCSNCGDSGMWKPISFLLVEIGRSEPVDFLVFKVTFPEPKGIHICSECLETPSVLDEEKITADLKTSRHSEDYIVKASCAINNLKNGWRLKFPA